MAVGYGAKIATEGLVFAYDMGNTKKSWKGTPTTNLIETDLLLYAKDNGCTVVLTGEYYQGSKVYRVTFPSGTLPRIRTNFAYTSGQTYSGSIYYRVATQGSHTPSLYFREAGFGAGYAQTTLNSAEWARAEITHTFSSSGTSMFLLYQATSTSTSPTVIDMTMPQVEINDFATPFVAGIRSNTQALLDWTGNNTVTTSSLTYNAEGDFDFIGVGGVGVAGDYISCGNSSIINFGTDNFTLSFICNRASSGYQGGSFISKGDGTSLGFDFRDSTFYIHGITGLIASKGFDPLLNVWQQHDFVFDRSTSPYIKYYLNGIYNSSSTTNNAANISSSINTSRNLDIGRSQAGGVQRYFNGKMPVVRLYNRALSTQEVQQNFNAIRGRYGL